MSNVGMSSIGPIGRQREDILCGTFTSDSAEMGRFLLFDLVFK